MKRPSWARLIAEAPVKASQAMPSQLKNPRLDISAPAAADLAAGAAGFAAGAWAEGAAAFGAGACLPAGDAGAAAGAGFGSESFGLDGSLIGSLHPRGARGAWTEIPRGRESGGRPPRRRSAVGHLVPFCTRRRHCTRTTRDVKT